jgi:hypothetical protein
MSRDKKRYMITAKPFLESEECSEKITKLLELGSEFEPNEMDIEESINMGIRNTLKFSQKLLSPDKLLSQEESRIIINEFFNYCTEALNSFKRIPHNQIIPATFNSILSCPYLYEPTILEKLLPLITDTSYLSHPILNKLIRAHTINIYPKIHKKTKIFEKLLPDIKKSGSINKLRQDVASYSNPFWIYGKEEEELLENPQNQQTRSTTRQNIDEDILTPQLLVS